MVRASQFSLSLALLAAAAVAGVGCGGTSELSAGVHVSPSGQPPTFPPTRLYLTNVGTSEGIAAFDLPISGSSTPVTTINTGGLMDPSGAPIGFDPAGRLYVADGSKVAVYTQPIRTGASPAFSFNTQHQPVEIALDAAGDAFVLEFTNRGFGCCYDVGVVPAPITGTSTESYAFPVSGYVVSIAVDGAGNFWVAADTLICQFAPPFSPASKPAFCFDTGGAGSGLYLRALAFDAAGDMYAAYDDGILVFQPPYSGSTQMAFAIDRIGHANLHRSVAFDPSGNLYTVSDAGMNLYVYSPPFSGSSTPSQTLSLTALGIAGGSAAIGP